MIEKRKYFHKKFTHNEKAANQIVPFIMSAYHPESVADIGCGTGTFLKIFKEHGVSKVCGIDGGWVNRELLFENITKDEFIEADLEKDLKLDQKFDVVLCLEVAEHLNEQSSDILINNLVNAGDTILFSAAIPYQGGQNHLNEQWTEYWVNKFSKHSYFFYDEIRPLIWKNPEIFWWYRQNIFVVKKTIIPQIETVSDSSIRGLSYVHPELYLIKAKTLDRILSGKESFYFYLMQLIKKVFPFLRK